MTDDHSKVTANVKVLYRQKDIHTDRATPYARNLLMGAHKKQYLFHLIIKYEKFPFHFFSKQNQYFFIPHFKDFKDDYELRILMQLFVFD